MIDKELQEYVKKKISKQEGQSYPCSNQIVTRSIILRDSKRIEAFEQAFPHFICKFRRGFYPIYYIDSSTEELWIMLFAKESIRGYRHYKAIIDSSIDRDIFQTLISPYMSHYCCKVDFF